MNSDVSTEARILEAACRLFYERGFHATSMRELAEEVGIKAGSFYHHFHSKEEILAAISMVSQREFLDGGVLSLEGVEDVRERLRTLILWQITLEAQHPYKAYIVDAQLPALDPASRMEVIRLRDAYEDLLTSILVEGNDQGYWLIDDLRVISMGIIGMCKIHPWYRNNGSRTPEQIAERYATFVIAGLEATGHI